MEKGKLSEEETALYDAIQKKEDERAKALIKSGKVRVDCLDEYGTTPLQQAAFKGSVELCELLLRGGANVNSNDHDHGYTALMFAALSGNADLCRVLMEAGAKTHMTNRIGRTASEMAAFTNHYHCVSVINNFLSQDDIEHLIHPEGSTDPPRLPLHFAEILHELTRTYNIHPVKTLLFVRAHPELLEHRKALLSFLEDLMERQMKQKDTNEVMALKLHIIQRTMREAFQSIDACLKENSKEDVVELLMKYVKSLLATKNENFPRTLELLVRQAVKEFPYHHSVLFQTIVKTLSKTPVGKEPSAVNIIHQTLLGHRMMMDEVFCATCGESRAQKRCSACKSVHYCSTECQKLHWFSHKKWCSQLAELYERAHEAQRAELGKENKTNPVEGLSSENKSDENKTADQTSDVQTDVKVDS